MEKAENKQHTHKEGEMNQVETAQHALLKGTQMVLQAAAAAAAAAQLGEQAAAKWVEVVALSTAPRTLL